MLFRSSTTDFAFIMGGHEVELQTAGEVRLGGGIMDELVLEESLRLSPDEGRARRALAQSPPGAATANLPPGG